MMTVQAWIRLENTGAFRARLFGLTALVLLCALPVFAQTPVGVWKTIDDTTGKPSGLIRIVDSNGILSGIVEKMLDPKDKPDAVCDLCTDERKDKPILGMTILRNIKKNTSDAQKWDGGDILDPNNGKVYRARLNLAENNKTLNVRGYIGTPLLGRSQVWERVE
jgi:uncharacterized protein (DUF2147 family)